MQPLSLPNNPKFQTEFGVKSIPMRKRRKKAKRVCKYVLSDHCAEDITVQQHLESSCCGVGHGIGFLAFHLDRPLIH